MLVQSNASLTLVRERGQEDEWRGGEAGTPPTLFAGSVRAYYQEKRERVMGAGQEDLLVRRSLIVEEGQPAVEFESEQIVQFTIDGDAVAKVGTVRQVERHRWAPAGVLQTTRLSLEFQ